MLESEDWIERTTPEKASEPHNLSTRLSDIYQLISEAIYANKQADLLAANNGVGILYKKISEEQTIFLVAPLKTQDETAHAHLKTKYQDVFAATEKATLYRKSWRSYPSLVLADQDLWEKIQKTDEKANLALSAEEADILKKSRNGHYPLFINGRPGSGKSTILQYLFAEHLYDYIPLADELKAPPLYLTYSQDLLEMARNNVEAILKSNAYHKLREDTPSDDEIDRLVESSFHTLKDYLYNLLPEDRKAQFPENGYIRYPEFRLWYEKTFGRDASLSDISAELAWHVIRSYIKGLSSANGEYLDDVEEFNELPGTKSVTSDTFERVASQIWQRYQELCKEYNYWDDQDLVREILTEWGRKEIQLPEHVVVFCDEAQDYSLNELRLIFRLSLFSRRRLTPEILDRLPFAFAGDPFQTLNPTGFDWGTIRGNFYTIIHDLLTAGATSKLEIHPVELTFNYRSRSDIVQLCNFIHLLRGIAFGKGGLEPQETWFQQASDMPVYFDTASEVFRSKIQQQKETVIILPCQEGEEYDFVQKDPFLAQFAQEDGQIARNILSPMRAKGLEYRRVVLYKFGETCWREYPNLLKILDGKRPPQNADPEETLPLEYFINRLYVAASRARKRLILADTKEGLENFWKRYFERAGLEEFVNAYKEIAPNSKWSKEHLSKIREGRQQDWEGDRDNPVQLAKDFEQRGRANKDVYLLEKAASNYRLANREDDALRCDAWRFELQENFLEAGKIWQKLGEQDKAKKLYWKARAFDLLASFDDGSLQQRTAQFMQTREKATFEHTLNTLREIENALEDGTITLDNVWSLIINTLYRDLLDKGSENSLKYYEWENLWRRAVVLRKKQILDRDDEVVRLHLRATPYPDKLILLQQYKRPGTEIVALYKANRSLPLENELVEIILQALRATGEKQELERLAKQYPSARHFALALAYHARYKNEAAYSWSQELLSLWEKESNWDAALDFVKGKHLEGVLDEKDAIAVRKYPWEKFALDVQFIKLLSVSTRLSDTSDAEKKTIFRYLNETLLQHPDVFSTRLTVQQAGGALERAGKVMDCLEFYEMVFQFKTWPANEEDQRFAKQRWLVCKDRQIDITNNDKRKREIQKEINKRSREWGINIDQLPTYPEVDVEAKPQPVSISTDSKRVFSPDQPLDSKEAQTTKLEDLLKLAADKQLHEAPTSPTPKPQPPAMVPLVKVEFQVSDKRFFCQLDRNRGKMTIQPEDGMEMVTLLAKKLSLQGSDEEMTSQIEVLRQSNHRAEYFVQPWNLTCVLRTSRQKRRVVYVDLYLGKKEFELLSLRLAE